MLPPFVLESNPGYLRCGRQVYYAFNTMTSRPKHRKQDHSKSSDLTKAKYLMLMSAAIKNLLKFLDLDSDPDHHQSLIIFSLCHS